MTIQEAKEFFITRIAAQAEMEGRPLSELERKILYFTESGTGATAEMLRGSARFDEQYKQEEYEEKIVELLNAAYARENSPEPYRKAYDVLRAEDHYVLVMLDMSIVATLATPAETKPRKWWQFWAS